MYLKGCDVSLWQDPSIITNEFDFVIAKASEGLHIKDKKFNAHLDRAKSLGINLVGSYHYARTLNPVEKDAANFLDAIAGREELGKTMLLALDIEGADASRPNCWQWARKWCDIVYNKTGVRPLVYTSASNIKHMKPLLDGNYGLWVAHWNASKPSISIYPFWAVWQYKVDRARNLDLDYFNGNAVTYKKYCERK